MAHHHEVAHLVRRQRDREQEEKRQAVETVFVTMSNTYTGKVVWVTQTPGAVVGPPMQRPSSKDEKPSPKDEKPASKAPATSKKASATPEPEPKPKETSQPASPKSTATTLRVATSSPTPSTTVAVASTAVGGLASATSALPSSTAAPVSSGMSGGAKAGLALGILLGIGALLAAVLFVYHRKKRQTGEKKPDDEKVAMRDAPPPPPPQVGTAPSVRTHRTMSTAPRLSLRPLTQFSPTFNDNRKSGTNPLNLAAAAPAARSLSPNQPNGSWEKPGAANAGAAAASNPFNDPHSRPNSPPQNPFGNNAAFETPLPASVLATPNHSANPSVQNDFANPASAIAAADAALVVATIPVSRKNGSGPPSIGSDMRSNASSVPPSPAWTEDFPASPGPAPTGPPPVAVAGGTPLGSAANPDNVHRVQMDFKPSMQDELSLRAGQLVRMLHEYDDGWALCIRLDRSQQGVVPRTCLSKHPVKPRSRSPPQGGPPGPRMRGPPMGSPMGPGGVPQPRPLTPSSGRNSPMGQGPRQMAPPGPPGGRARSNSNAPYAGPPRSMSPGPYGGGPQNLGSPPRTGRPRSSSTGHMAARRPVPPGPSPMNPLSNSAIPPRKPLPGMAL
ncbi:hypothetical protein BDV95DRAFT_561231 [Massariosphaeria phaeospora]|uniref:SH3 domain-containing protein n=1 Tax=Massariosphaeria phaeospora TaxID=100035 RepID=A0A7C8IDB9_9PLEO|nr:hypothetical protein BDV95DRAFT_561231 [Massariosphaeria phaeospora]